MIKFLFLIFLILPLNTYAEKYGDFGLTFQIAGSGYIFPKLREVKVSQVTSGSSAEVEGISVGDLIVSINGCEIPGCSAKKAKSSVLKSVGETLSLRLRNKEGQLYDVVLTAREYK